MEIKMLVQISGTRNGEDWPAPGSIVDLPDDEAATLIVNGSAANVDDHDETEVAAFGNDGVETAVKKPSRAAKKAAAVPPAE